MEEEEEEEEVTGSIVIVTVTVTVVVIVIVIVIVVIVVLVAVATVLVTPSRVFFICQSHPSHPSRLDSPYHDVLNRINDSFTWIFLAEMLLKVCDSHDHGSGRCPRARGGEGRFGCFF